MHHPRGSGVSSDRSCWGSKHSRRSDFNGKFLGQRASSTDQQKGKIPKILVKLDVSQLILNVLAIAFRFIYVDLSSLAGTGYWRGFGG